MSLTFFKLNIKSNSQKLWHCMEKLTSPENTNYFILAKSDFFKKYIYEAKRFLFGGKG